MRLSLILGVIAIALGIGGYLDQELRCGAHWDWPTLWHHEPFVAIAICVGIALLVMSIGNNTKGG